MSSSPVTALDNQRIQQLLFARYSEGKIGPEMGIQQLTEPLQAEENIRGSGAFETYLADKVKNAIKGAMRGSGVDEKQLAAKLNNMATKMVSGKGAFETYLADKVKNAIKGAMRGSGVDESADAITEQDLIQAQTCRDCAMTWFPYPEPVYFESPMEREARAKVPPPNPYEVEVEIPDSPPKLKRTGGRRPVIKKTPTMQQKILDL